MDAKNSERLARVNRERFRRARELLAHAETLGVEIGWDGEYTTFTPANVVPQRFIEEATILSAYIKAIKQGRS